MSQRPNAVQLLSAATATNGAPSGATAGFAIRRPVDRALFQLKSTAGSGTMTVTIKFWVYCEAMGEWAPLGTHATDATRGILNGGNAIGEVIADGLRHAEMVSGLMRVSRVYAEITAIGGTSTAVTAWLDCMPCDAVTGA